MATPNKLIADKRTAATLHNLGKLGATREEAAAVLGVSRVALWAFLDKNPDIADQFTAGLDVGKVKLRRLQWRAAENGNATMLIWLGKQMLKQLDQPPREDEVTRENIEALKSEFERKLASIAEASEEERVASKPDA